MKTFVKNKLPSVLFAFLMLMISVNLIAQPGHGKRFEQKHEKIKARKIAYITQKMDLTTDEAQKFWPLYNEFDSKRESLMHGKSFSNDPDFNIDDMTDEELLDYMDKEIANAEELVSLRREYHEKYLQILPPKKVALLYKAEKDFNRELFREMRQRGHMKKRPGN
ncbi:MAG: hypothetical protein ACOCWC_02135 [Bacteroidota bacterium]